MRRTHGLTIVECLVAMTILSVIVLVTCFTLAAGQQHVYEGNRIATAVRLGRDLLEEITARDYRDRDGSTAFGPEADELTRAAFDDVDDYQGYVEAPGSLVDATGISYPSADQVFRRKVSVAKSALNVPDLGGSLNGLTVTVTVQTLGGRQWVFTRFLPEPAQ